MFTFFISCCESRWMWMVRNFESNAYTMLYKTKLYMKLTIVDKCVLTNNSKKEW